MDLPFSVIFYRWLLGQEHSLSLEDLAYVVPAVHSTLIKMHKLVNRRNQILADLSLSGAEKTSQVSNILYNYEKEKNPVKN